MSGKPKSNLVHIQSTIFKSLKFTNDDKCLSYFGKGKDTNPYSKIHVFSFLIGVDCIIFISSCSSSQPADIPNYCMLNYSSKLVATVTKKMFSTVVGVNHALSKDNDLVSVV